jgi:hypothetical protein
MAFVKTNFLPSIAYNTLPHIHELSDVTKNKSDDPEHLRSLLRK